MLCFYLHFKRVIHKETNHDEMANDQQRQAIVYLADNHRNQRKLLELSNIYENDVCKYK